MGLREHRDPLTGETLLSGKSHAGLPVRLLRRCKLRHFCCILAVNYGSVDSRFVPPGRDRAVSVPEGIAHFLEHKMFEKERGDLLPEFARRGAHANAMTSHSTTSFIVSSTGNFRENLDLLLELVFDAHFTPELVEKEQGIIAQEIRGYDDQPGWQGFRHVMRNLFRRHPVREEIAGTVESIRRITADDLRLCHNSFYVPANMVLCAMGDLDPSEVLAAVDAKLKTDGRGGLMARRNLPAEPLSLAQPQSRLTMPVSLPRLYLGFKGPVARLAPTVGADAECAAELWLDAVLGEAGEPYERLYASGLITDDFAWSVTHDAGMTWAIVGGQTPDAAELRNELSSILEAGRREDAFDEDLGRVRKRFLGDYIRSFDSPETCCWNVVESHFRKLDLFTYPNRVARLKAGRVARYCRDFFTPARMTEVTIIPAGT